MLPAEARRYSGILKTPLSHPLTPVLIAVVMLSGMGAAAVVEDFDGGWVDAGYGGISSYNHAGVGMWESSDCLVEDQTAKTRSSPDAIRFNDGGGTPYLEFQGLDGNGIDGGVGTVSFWYRHWDGDGSTISFELQYNINGAGWVTAGAAGTSEQTAYAQFTRVLDLTGNNILLRIVTTANPERLIVDDFEATDNGTPPDPTISFTTGSSASAEEAGIISIPVQLSPAGAGTVNVSASGGSAISGSDYTLLTSSLTFTTGNPTQQVQVSLQDDAFAETSETLVLVLSSPTGADLGTDTHTLTITDTDPSTTGGGSGVLTVMAANTTSGNGQDYQAPGERIFQAFDPDIVGIQEFNIPNGETEREWVDRVFGTEFDYMVEAGNEQIPNGIISRYPITASGEWQDTVVSNRDFAWATIDIPGPTDLHVVSVHLYSSGSASDRNTQANIIVSNVTSQFPASDYIVLTGDFNTNSRGESAINTFKTIFSDAHVPVDQLGDDDTNQNRNNPYDWVMPNAPLEALHTTLTIGGVDFVDGIVFDSRLWTTPPTPVLSGDSGVSGMQHMAVVKTYSISAPQFTAQGTPYSWMESYGITSDQEANDLLDLDGDGLLTWQEYLSDTHPNDASSTFEMEVVDDGGSVAINCQTRPDRLYRIEFADEPAVPGTPLDWIPFATGAAGQHDTSGGVGGAHVFTDDFGPGTTLAPPTGSARLYRIGVSLP